MHAKLAVLALAALLAGCAQDEPPPDRKPPQGRAETRAIRNTDAVGNNGSATANAMDQALDAQEQANRRNREVAEQAGD